MSPFDYLNSINYTKEDIMIDDISEKKYSAFMVNRGLSFFYDTVVIANEMNQKPYMDNKLQYDFLRLIVRKKKRFSSWAKAEKIDRVEDVMEYYGYSREKALQVLPLLKGDQLDYIRKKISKGGKR
jgi:hypothetical protein